MTPITHITPREQALQRENEQITKPVKVKPIPGKPETWPKNVSGSEKCLCGSKNWHPECYRAVPFNSMSVRSIFSHDIRPVRTK